MKRIEKFEIHKNMINVVQGNLEVILDISEEDDKCFLWAIVNDSQPFCSIQVIGWAVGTNFPAVPEYDFSNILLWMHIGRTGDIVWFAEDPIMKLIEDEDDEVCPFD